MGRWDSVTVNVQLVGFSARSTLVAVAGRERGVWLPDQYIIHGDVRVGEWFDVTMPRWLAQERGLV